jgi:hypothetical protein
MLLFTATWSLPTAMRLRRPVLPVPAPVFGPAPSTRSIILPCLDIQSVTTIKFCNHFILLTIRIAAGGSTPLMTAFKKHLKSPIKKHLKSRVVLRCKFTPLFSITSRMLLPQPFPFMLLHGGVYGGTEFRVSIFEFQPLRG